MISVYNQLDEHLSSPLDYFEFGLEDGVTLWRKRNHYAITSRFPMRIMRINKAMYDFINRLVLGCPLSHILHDKTRSEKKAVSALLLSLVSNGYLKIVNTPLPVGWEHYPYVSIIIPVKNRPDQIHECLLSLNQLDYPKDKMEVIVVNDGSTDDTSLVVSTFNVKLISLPESKGPAFCRNVGVKEAKGEVIAFIDSDCTSDPSWLKCLIPFFSFDGIGAVGGLVNNYFNATALDKYEAAYSSLNMGDRIIFDPNSHSGFYVPTCNLLVSRDVFYLVNGFNEDMHIGEDVDFCWRIRDLGYYLLYVPTGVVAHKHRNDLIKMLKRKFDYGTSEADLYYRHKEKRKKFPIPIYGTLSFIVLLLTGLLGHLSLIFIIIGLLIVEFISKLKTIRDNPLVEFNPKILIWAIAKSTLSTYHYISFHLFRYYIIPLILTCFFFPKFLICITIIILIPSLVKYFQKRPDLNIVVFTVFFSLENLFYQVGVFVGCLKIGSFRCYSLRFKK